MEAGGDLLRVVEFMVLLVEMLLHLALHALHEDHFFVQLVL